MKHLALLLTASILSAPAVIAEGYRTGMIPLSLPDAQGARDLSGYLWYPTETTEPSTPMYDSAVWVPPEVVKEAEPARARFPLIVLSHGLYGNSYNQAWLAAEMAARGYLVAAIDHPGTSTWSRDPGQRRALWERPRDISRVIDAVLSPDGIGVQADPDRIYMAGHSLGGFTAALLAGARYESMRIDRFCAAVEKDLVCSLLNDWEVARIAEERAEIEADLSDPRIRAFAVFDLGLTQAFSPESLGQIDRPMLVYGAPIMNSGLVLDNESRALVSALPAANTTYLEPEGYAHFDFLGQCTPAGRAILAEEEPGDEMICDNGGAPRAEKHRQIIETLSAFFDAS